MSYYIIGNKAWIDKSGKISGMKLAVSIIVLDDFTYLMGALRSLMETTRTSCDVFVVVDNMLGRDDPQINRLLSEFPDVTLI